MMKKILVIQTASIGDVILATPVLEKLHTYFPEADIDILVKKGNEGLFTAHPFIHEVLVWNKQKRSLMNFDQLMHKVWYAKYELVVNLQRFFLTGLMTAFSGAAIKTGFNKNPLSFLFTKKIPHLIQSNTHEIERNLSLIDSFTGPGLVKPRLYPADLDFEKVIQYKHSSYYTLSPASLWYTKQYPAGKWAELIREMPSGHPVYLLGSPADHPLCEQIILESGSNIAVNLSGKLTFLESSALMKDARMNFTNDSAPLHLASAVNAPVTVVYCSTIPGFGFGPLSDDSAIVEIQEELKCRPCGLHGLSKCPRGHFHCAVKIPESLLLKRC